MVVTLIGYRGCGKSTVASLLAIKLGWSWIDADVEIERRAGKTIREIFRDEGEPSFRKLEREVMHELMGGNKLVVAAGGGAILDPDTRTDLHRAGPVIWLKASVATLAHRLQTDADTDSRRPTLTQGSAIGEIAAVLAEREPLYQSCSTHVVTTDEQTPAEIANAIFDLLQTSWNAGDPS